RQPNSTPFPYTTLFRSHKETPLDAVARIEQVMQANPDISGWGLLGGWPLFTDNALRWAPGTIKCVAVDALPPELRYVRSGHVQLDRKSTRLNSSHVKTS